MYSMLSHQSVVLVPPAVSPLRVERLSASGAMKKQQQISLADLPVGVGATVAAISSSNLEADIAMIQRLAEIGFVPGEKVKVIAHGHPGREPIAVRIGGTTFALRRFEADYIYVVADA